MHLTLIAAGNLVVTSDLHLKQEVLAARILQAAQQNSLTSFIEHLGQLLSSPPLGEEAARGVLADQKHRPHLIQWIRQNPNMFISLMWACRKSKDNPLQVDLSMIDLDAIPDVGTHVAPMPAADIPLNVTTSSPLSHGSDSKLSNLSMFRRQTMLCVNGGHLNVPYYSGNAVRGQLRNLLAADFVQRLNLKPTMWFFSLLFEGGSLDERAISKSAAKAFGVRANSVELRDRAALRAKLPFLSLFGVALPGQPISGQMEVRDLLPQCITQPTALHDLSSLISYEYLTRRSDDECAAQDDTKSAAMIASHEVMVAGAQLTGGIDLRQGISPTEASCLTHGLHLLMQQGRFGGSTRRGWGIVQISIPNLADLPTPEGYLSTINDDLRTWLREVEAIAQ